MTLANMKIGRKLGVGFACVLLVVAVMSLTLFTTVKSLVAANEVNTASNLAVNDVDLAIAAMREQSRASLRFVLTRADRYAKAYDEAVASFADNIAAAHKDAAGHADILALIDKIQASGEFFRHEFGDETMRLVRDNPSSDAAAKFVNSDAAVAAFDSFKAIAADARTKINDWSTDIQTQLDRLVAAMDMTLLVGSGAAVLLAALVGLSLPLTLAVLDGMVVTAGGQTLVVPLTAIVETLQPKIADVHGFGGGARVIAIREEFTPLIDVGRELGYRDEPADAVAGVAILVESESGARFALLVDAILGQRQVVIKSLEANYQHVAGIAAATILGDGRVALILDVDAVVASSRADAQALDHLLATAG